MLNILYVVGIVFFFSLTIFIHELGHFLLARWCGLIPEVFSIGFGPALWQKNVRGVTYKIGVIPFGGYVALPQLDPTGESVKSEEKNAAPKYPPVSPWRKIIVAAAGATFNLLLAFLLACVLYKTGKPSSPAEVRCVVGYVVPDSVTAKAGLREGDTILSADDEPVANWQNLIEYLTLQPGDAVRLRVRSENGNETQMTLPTFRRETGIRVLADVEQETLISVAGLMPGGSAQAAGLRPRDRILRFDSQKMYSTIQFSDRVEACGNRDASLTFRRDGRESTVTVHPDYFIQKRTDGAASPEDPIVARYLIGINFDMKAVDPELITHPAPIRQIRDNAGSIFRLLRALVSRKTGRTVSKAIGGPVSILTQYWLMFRASFLMAIWFTILLNVNLAILNLLPIPVLDGGHIVFSFIEGVTRKPVHPAVINWLYRIFATLLISLFLLITVRDVRRMADGFLHKEAPIEWIRATPPTETNAPPVEP